MGLERRIQFKCRKIVCSLLVYVQKCKTSFLHMIQLFLYLFRFTTDIQCLTELKAHNNSDFRELADINIQTVQIFWTVLP